MSVHISNLGGFMGWHSLMLTDRFSLVSTRLTWQSSPSCFRISILAKPSSPGTGSQAIFFPAKSLAVLAFLGAKRYLQESSHVAAILPFHAEKSVVMIPTTPQII